MGCSPIVPLGDGVIEQRGLDAPKSPLSGERLTPWVGCDDVEFVDRRLAKTHMGWDVIPDGLTATG